MTGLSRLEGLIFEAQAMDSVGLPCDWRLDSRVQIPSLPGPHAKDLVLSFYARLTRLSNSI